MYLKLKDLLYYFEGAFENEPCFLNLFDYQVYSKEEKCRLINTEICHVDDFLQIPRKDFDEIVVKFLLEKNNVSLLRKKEEKDFYRKFHWYTEDNHLVNDWRDFEEAELIAFASEWCDQNQIKFTVK